MAYLIARACPRLGLDLAFAYSVGHDHSMATGCATGQLGIDVAEMQVVAGEHHVVPTSETLVVHHGPSAQCRTAFNGTSPTVIIQDSTCVMR